MNYQQLIESTVVPGMLTYEEKYARYHQVTQYINAILPDQLYRFRSCTERSLSAFWNDELWFSNGSVMNDDFDARLYYNRQDIINGLESLLLDDAKLQCFSEISRMANISQEEIAKVAIQLVDYVRNNLDASLVEITRIVQANTKFACFSEDIYSDMMWGHYAENATGFALEYSFTNGHIMRYEEDNTVHCNLFPIIYSNSRLDTTEYAKYLYQIQLLMSISQNYGLQLSQQWITSVIPCPDEFMVTKLALEKSHDWESEKEWRLFYISMGETVQQQRFSYVSQKPSAVYLGRKISKFHQKIICDMAKEKDIPVYKMGFIDDSRMYRLQRNRVES